MNTKHDLEWLLKANKFIDPDLQNTLGFRLSFFYTLLPDDFPHPHALLVGTLMHYSSRMVNKSLRRLLDLGFLEKPSRSLYRKSNPSYQT